VALNLFWKNALRPQSQPLLLQPKVGQHRMQNCWANLFTLNAFWNTFWANVSAWELNMTLKIPKRIQSKQIGPTILHPMLPNLWLK
jgi:hypothetical protein